MWKGLQWHLLTVYMGHPIRDPWKTSEGIWNNLEELVSKAWPKCKDGIWDKKVESDCLCVQKSSSLNCMAISGWWYSHLWPKAALWEQFVPKDLCWVQIRLGWVGSICWWVNRREHVHNTDIWHFVCHPSWSDVWVGCVETSRWRNCSCLWLGPLVGSRIL